MKPQPPAWVPLERLAAVMERPKTKARLLLREMAQDGLVVERNGQWRLTDEAEARFGYWLRIFTDEDEREAA